MSFNLIKEGLKQQAMALELSKNVIQFPTTAQALAIRAKGKKLAHKPESLRTFNNNDFPPEAA